MEVAIENRENKEGHNGEPKQRELIRQGTYLTQRKDGERPCFIVTQLVKSQAPVARTRLWH